MDRIKRTIGEAGLAKRIGEKVVLKHFSDSRSHIGRVGRFNGSRGGSFYVDTEGCGIYAINSEDILTVAHRSNSGKGTYHRYKVQINQQF